MRHPIRCAVLVMALLVPTAALAQSEWDANKGDCDRTLQRARLKELDAIRSCTELWETYRDVSVLRPEEKAAVARGFSVLVYKGGTRGRMLGKTALDRIHMQPLEEEEVLPRNAEASDGREVIQPKYYPEVSARRQKESEKNVAKGLKLHKKKTHKALGYYEKAMRADPNNLKAFYNAACAYGLLGDAGAASEVLDEIRSRHTRRSRQLLMSSRKDRDFRRVRHHPKFKAATGYAEIVLLNGAAAEGTPHIQRLKRRLADAGRPPAFVGTDESPRGRPIIWHKPGMEEVAEELKELVDPDKTRLKIIDFNTAIDKYDFDVYVVWGMPHRAALNELPDVGKRQGGGAGEDGAQDPLKAAKEAKGVVDDAAGLVKPPELPELP